MKRILFVFSVILALGTLNANAQCCAGSKTAVIKSSSSCSEATKDACQVKAYYFHATRRCATCQAVETVTTETLEEYYKGKVAFQSINREENKDNPLVKKYKISGQTLLIVKGDKVVNLTNDAFMNARTKPEKLKAKIKATIDSMI